MDIPRQLIGARLIKVDMEKRPIEKDWQTFRNYSYEDAAFRRWADQNNRYGVCCGFNDLLVIDYDNQEFQEKTYQKFPTTFTVKTARKGLFHLYFYADSCESWKVLDKDKNTLCDIQGKGKQVVGAGTIIADGRQYMVIKNIPIAKVSAKLLHEVLDEHNTKEQVSPPQRARETFRDDMIGMIKAAHKISDVLRDLGISTTRNPTQCPLHESKGGKCFSFNDKLRGGVYHCFHCESKGDVITLFEKTQNITTGEAVRQLYMRVRSKIITKPTEINDFKVIDLSNKWDVAVQIYDINPYFYDETGSFWVWNYSEHCYIRKDDTGMLKSMEKYTSYKLWVVKNTQRIETFNAFRVYGRGKIPKTPPKTWIQFQEVIVDVITGERMTATPEYWLTNPIPFKIGDRTQTAILDRIFSEWVDTKYVSTLYEIIAYSLLRWQPCQRIFALTGAGANGKGTFQKIISKFVGNNNIITTSLDKLSISRFATSALYRKLVCLIGEVTHNDLKDTKIIKALSGEDLIDYEFKGKTSISEESYTTCIISTNSLPSSPDKSIGFFRRWLIIDFPNQFTIKRDILSEITDEELECLSAKCISILPKLLSDREFTNEGDIMERTRRYEHRSDPLLHFLSEKCVDDINGQVLFSEFYKEFCVFLKQENHRKMNKIQVSKGLQREQYITQKTSVDGIVGAYIIGIKWKIDVDLSGTWTN